MWLLESWEKPDLDLWADGQRGRPLPEGVIFGHQEYRPADVRRLLDDNPTLDFFEYFNVWTYPDPSWLDQGNAYFDAVWSLLARGDIWSDPTSNYPGITPKDRMVIRWTDGGAAIAVAAMLASRRHPRANFFLDVFEPRGPFDWMFKSFNGAFSVDRLPDDQVGRHQTALELMARPLVQHGKVTTNGTLGHETPGYGLAARYFEQVGTQPGSPWSSVIPEWKRHSGNVLSVLAEDKPQVDQALANWLTWGGWLAFTCNIDGEAGVQATRAAYDRARSLRESLALSSARKRMYPGDPDGPPPTPPTDPTDPTDPTGGLTP